MPSDESTKLCGDERIGQFSINIENQETHMGVTLYTIRVSRPGGSYTIHRRYRDFEQLHRDMFAGQVQAGTSEAQATTMPPKSFWRKRFSHTFKEEREQGLNKLALNALEVAADADVRSCPPALLKFMGLDEEPVSGVREETDLQRIGHRLQDSFGGIGVDAKQVMQSCEEAFEHQTHAELQEHFPAIYEEHFPAIYKVVNDEPPTGTLGSDSGLQYRFLAADEPLRLANKYQPCDTFVVGIDQGDGFLKVEVTDHFEFKIDLYLPFRQNSIILEQTTEHVLAQFLVTSKHLSSNFVLGTGLEYRNSKDLDDLSQSHFMQQEHPWGTLVVGVDEGDGWLRVGRRLLPMVLDGCPVLEVKKVEQILPP